MTNEETREWQEAARRAKVRTDLEKLATRKEPEARAESKEEEPYGDRPDRNIGNPGVAGPRREEPEPKAERKG